MAAGICTTLYYQDFLRNNSQIILFPFAKKVYIFSHTYTSDGSTARNSGHNFKGKHMNKSHKESI